MPIISIIWSMPVMSFGHAGANFGELHQQGIDAMVARVEIDYKVSLISGNRFLLN